MSLAMRPNEVNTEVQYDCKVRHQAVIFLYTEVQNMRKNMTEIVFILDRSGVKAKLFCPEIAGLFCRIAGLFCHDSRANLSLKPVCFGIAIS